MSHAATMDTVLRRTGETAPVSLESTRTPGIELTLRWIASDRDDAQWVGQYETTDRTGRPVTVIVLHFGPERWAHADFLTDIYVIPGHNVAQL